MRFVLGPPPDDPDFVPEPSDWRRVRLPGSWALLAIGSVIGILLCSATALGWSLVPLTSTAMPFGIGWLGIRVPAILIPLLILFQGVLYFVMLTIVHELIHALAFPGFGLSSGSILGFWSRRILPYADYHGPLPCWRFVVVGVAPLATLSVAPLLISLLVGSASKFWILVSVVNALGSGGDVLIVGLVLSQVPIQAVIRNKAWETWWQPAEPDAVSDPGNND